MASGKVEEIARSIAADLGPEYSHELERQLVGEAASASNRSVWHLLQWGNPSDTANHILSAIQIVSEVWEKRRDEALLAEDIAKGLEIDPRLAYHLSYERRLGFFAKVVDRVLPQSFGRSERELEAARLEKARWVAAFEAKQNSLEARADDSLTKPPARSFENVPVLVPFAEQYWWYTYRPTGWVPNAAQGTSGLRVDVPRGFVTDLASIPPYLWAVLQKTGRHGNAAILHDWLYWQQNLTREQADDVFNQAMAYMEVEDTTRRMIWIAVRLFGERYWRQNGLAYADGERRVLRRFPKDPRVTWAAWKTDPNNFE